MANVRDSDTSLWLHNKLGTSNDLWSGGSICSQLSQDVLRNIKECFIDLQAQVKLKLLLSFLHIPRRNVDEWKVELEEILELATVDSDQWVSMLAELLKVYPSTGMINMEVEENSRVFTELVVELKKLVKKTTDTGMIPLECLYLNKSALSVVVGQQVQPAKHFTLKRKPKSAALRAELLQKSNDAANNLKKNTLTCSVPIRSRSLAKRMDDTTPLKGLPSRTTSNSFRSPPPGIRRLSSASVPPRPLPKTPAGRKDGGIKLLEITEQPIGFGREAKRRKKLQDEVVEAQKKEALASSSPTAASTPDYAAGLVAPMITSQLPTAAAPLSALPGSTFVPSTSSQNIVLPMTTSCATLSPVVTSVIATAAAAAATTIATVVTTSTTSTAHVLENIQQIVQPQSTRIQVVAAPVPHTAMVSGSTTPLTPLQPLAAAATALPQQTAQPQQQQPLPQQQQQQQTVQIQVQKKGLSLTREQMQEAQEMFRTANKVTRPEKALILGFMAGARDNPCPHLGNIVTIKLSESQESLKQQDGSLLNVVVEMNFQMNYTTGEWKRVRKIRKVDD